MGMFDEIDVFMKCPYCGRMKTITAQTKDLSNAMHQYKALHKDWYKKGSMFNYKFDQKPMREAFPKDKEPSAWKCKMEFRKAAASIPDEFADKLKFVNVSAQCHSVECQFDADRRDILHQGTPSGFGRLFDGKIKIKNGMLFGEIYDIKKDGYTEKELSKYKEKYSKIFKKLKKKYKYEPIICRNWSQPL